MTASGTLRVAHSSTSSACRCPGASGIQPVSSRMAASRTLRAVVRPRFTGPSTRPSRISPRALRRPR
eukprot:5665840-Heterocapsa_arctica.AAC.1